jgi:dCMP deaminase
MSANLIAYIPTLNARHLDWLARHKESDLLLVSQEEAEGLLPRLARNMAAVPTSIVLRTIEAERLVRAVWPFGSEISDVDLSSDTWNHWVLPDEDISHLVADKYLVPAGCKVTYEMIWARWDMKAVFSEQPVMPDVEISVDELDREFINRAQVASERSPDWWRRVGAFVADADGNPLAIAYNTHMPNEYETYIFSDPAINRDAGQAGKSIALHAEDGAITDCARYGRAVDGGKIYVTTFPCKPCAGKIVRSGIRTVYFREGYSTLDAISDFHTHGVKVVQVK